jgi:hypothetical protein
MLSTFDFGKNQSIAMPHNQINRSGGAPPSSGNQPIALEPQKTSALSIRPIGGVDDLTVSDLLQALSRYWPIVIDDLFLTLLSWRYLASDQFSLSRSMANE